MDRKPVRAISESRPVGNRGSLLQRIVRLMPKTLHTLLFELGFRAYKMHVVQRATIKMNVAQRSIIRDECGTKSHNQDECGTKKHNLTKCATTKKHKEPQSR